MEVAVIQMLSFLAVMLFVSGMAALLTAKGDEPSLSRRRGAVLETFGREIETVGRLLAPSLDRAFPQKGRRIKGELLQAALADRMTARDIRGMQGLACGVGGLMALICVYGFSMNLAMAGGVAVFVAFLGWVYPAIWLSRAARERTERVTKALPYAIDLLTVAMEAGQDFGAALRYVVTEGPPGALSEEFSVTLHQTELGKSRVEALRSLAERIQLDEMDQLVSAVVQSTETGGSVVGTLKVQAEDIRRRRFHRAERKAAKAPSIMMIPVALFILPAVFIIIFTPVGIRMSESLGAME